jgi:hypothetical protein
MRLDPIFRAWLLQPSPNRLDDAVRRAQREAIVADLEAREEPRTAGGPGSGHFGHAGRKGLGPGGSLPGKGSVTSHQQAAATPAASTVSVSNSISAHDARTRIDTLGARTAGVADLPKNVINGWMTPEVLGGGGLTKPPTDVATIPAPIVEGVVDGLQALEGTAAGEAVKDKVRVMFVDYEHDAQATTVTDNANGEGFLVVNGNKTAIDYGVVMSTIGSTMSGKAAVKSGLTGDGLQRELYKNIIIHEAAHVLDGANGGQLSEALVYTLMFTTGGGDIPAFLKRRVSDYAAVGGPREAFAEIFLATAQGVRIEGLEDLQAMLKRNYLTKH